MSRVTEPRAVATDEQDEADRYRSRFSKSFARIEPIPDPRFGENVARLRRIRFDLLSQLADEYPQVFILLGVIAAPHGSQQRPMCQNLSGIAHEVDHQVEFFRR